MLRAAWTGVASALRGAAGTAGRAIASAWRRRPAGGRAAALAFAAAVAGAGASSVLFQARLPSRLPSSLDWAALGALLERDAQPGDGVLVSPRWAERIRAVAPTSAPIVALGDAAEEDLPGVRRIWLVSIPGAPRFSFETERTVLARGASSDGPQRLGALEVTRYALTFPIVPLAFLPDRLAGAEVIVGERPCATEREGFRCPGAAAVRVAREIRELAGAPRPCVAASPNPEAGAPLAVTFRSVPAGRVLRVHAGAAGGGAAVRLAVQLDGEEHGAIELTGAGGWTALPLDTTRHAGREPAISFVVTGAGPDAPSICFDAVTLP